MKYVGYIASTGQIIRATLPMGQIPEEGTVTPEGLTVKYIESTNGLTLGDFITHKYYNSELEAFASKGERPNVCSTWNGSSWDVNYPQYLDYIREQRNARLIRSDWTQIPDAPLTEEQKAEALIYRQALRDMVGVMAADPDNYQREEDIPWPIKPNYI